MEEPELGRSNLNLILFPDPHFSYALPQTMLCFDWRQCHVVTENKEEGEVLSVTCASSDLSFKWKVLMKIFNIHEISLKFPPQLNKTWEQDTLKVHEVFFLGLTLFGCLSSWPGDHFANMSTAPTPFLFHYMLSVDILLLLQSRHPRPFSLPF